MHKLRSSHILLSCVTRTRWFW